MEECPIASTPVLDIHGDIGIGRPRRHNHETKLAEELKRRGIGFFMPMQKEERFWGNRRRVVWRKVFPGMIFIGNGTEGRDVADANRRIRSYEHVHPRYQPKLKSELSIIEKNVTKQEPFQELAVGVKVEVKDGPYKYAQGVIERRDKPTRFTVAMNLPWRPGTTPVEIDAAMLEAV